MGCSEHYEFDVVAIMSEPCGWPLVAGHRPVVLLLGDVE